VKEIADPTPVQIAALRDYIGRTWRDLCRSHEHLLDAARDLKVDHAPGSSWPVYISPKEDCARVERTLLETLSTEELNQIEIRTLPSEVEMIRDHGLLYLPTSYVVPGGKFNEMYGWDCYFIQLGLIRDQEMTLSRNLVDLQAYQIEHYGMVLNANRTYYLTRSQPPLFTPMIRNQYERTEDREWLESVLPSAESYYYFWKVPPHLNQATGLSRYYDLGEGPAPEVLVSERDASGRTHYDKVQEYYRTHPVADYDVALYYDSKRDRLTDLFYKGDRSMRESGFDPTNRFGPFSVDIIHYAPVCLNVLLYQMEMDLCRLHEILGNTGVARCWEQRAIHRRELIDRFLWDPRAGLYLDYNFQTGERREYPYVTTFFPLWAGIASTEQARRVVEQLETFERCGGLRTSAQVTGSQWDAPFGWAPTHLIAIEGLRRYGYDREASRIARKFTRMAVAELERSGTLVEKYDVDRCSGEVSDEILFGYSSNEIGFGWTNGVLSELIHSGALGPWSGAANGLPAA
jgi:alpha,alpha-trehalase